MSTQLLQLNPLERMGSISGLGNTAQSALKGKHKTQDHVSNKMITKTNRTSISMFLAHPPPPTHLIINDPHHHHHQYSSNFFLAVGVLPDLRRPSTTRCSVSNIDGVIEAARLELDIQPVDGDTKLHIGARNGTIKDVSKILRYKKYLDRKNKMGDTPLHVAARFGQLDTVVVLTHVIISLKKNKLIGEKNKAGNTPLHLALINDDHERVATHLARDYPEAGGERNKLSITPMQLAYHFGARNVLAYLLMMRGSVN